MKIHELKATPKDFTKLADGAMKFDIRQRESQINVGDLIVYRPFEDANYLQIFDRYLSLKKRPKLTAIDGADAALFVVTTVKQLESETQNIVIGLESLHIPETNSDYGLPD